MLYHCKAFKCLTGQINNILLFGLVHPVKPYKENIVNQATKNGLYYYCDIEDENGNKYKLYTDYEPCLQISKTIAFKID